MPPQTLSYTDAGTGRPVLLIHGYPLDRTMWADQITHLAANYRVIAPDLRGFGASSMFDGDPATGIAMSQYADDLLHLLDELQVSEPVVLCGFSMGGYISFPFVEQHRAKVAALVLCDTRAAADTADARAKRLETAQQVHDHGSGWIAEQMIPKLFAEATRRDRPELVDRTADVIRRTDPDAIAAALRGMAHRSDSTPLLAQLDLPTLVIVGEDDAISTRDEMTGIAKAVRGAELVVVPDAGHMAPVENAATVTKTLQKFLARL
jgi:pimeloyl-ACP methyl ester carboxylesterase